MTEKDTEPKRIVVDYGHKPLSADEVSEIAKRYQELHLNGTREKAAVKAFVQQTERRTHDTWLDQFEANQRTWQAAQESSKKGKK